MKTIEEILASNIRRRRKALKLTQEKLAFEARISPITMNRIEKGKQAAQRSSLRSIAVVLGCTVEDLYKPPDATSPIPADALEAIKAAAREGAVAAQLEPDEARILDKYRNADLIMRSYCEWLLSGQPEDWQRFVDMIRELAKNRSRTAAEAQQRFEAISTLLKHLR